MNVLVLNPGGNSLKVQQVSCSPDQRRASEGRELLSVMVEDIGKSPVFSVLQGKETLHTEPAKAGDYGEAATHLLRWLKEEKQVGPKDIACAGVRVVHGGSVFDGPAEIDEKVEKQIHSFERLAPLHKKSSLEVLRPIRQALGSTPIYAVFDTAFHRTIPELAARYAIPCDLADKHGIRRYGFHGTSHRYLMERAADLLGKPAPELNLITTHLESGCSVTAIARGRSIENTMGFTPLEGLMMGTRSGDVDPALIEFLVREEDMTVEDVMTLLNKKSGLLGVSGKSLDTRVLMKEYGKTQSVTLAMDMFCYRLVKAVGACLCALGGADAIVFGGGIGENTPLVRERVGLSLGWAGLSLDAAKNESLTEGEGNLTADGSAFQALVAVTQEGLQIAHECCQAESRRSS
jgi:acetate kinase